MRKSSYPAAAVVVLLALGAVALGGCKKEATITKKAPAPGLKVKEERHAETKLSMTISLPNIGQPPQTTEVGSEETSVLTREFLEVKDGKPTRVKITYDSNESVQHRAGRDPVKHQLELVGKSFIAEVKDGGIAVSDENGTPADELAQKTVQTDARELIEPARFVFDVPDRELKVGDSVPELATLLKSLVSREGSDGPKPDVSDVTAKLREKKDGVALFDVTITVSQQAGLKMKTELKGTLGLRLDSAWLTELSLEGPVTMEQSLEQTAPGASMHGKGTMTMSRKLTYL